MKPLLWAALSALSVGACHSSGEASPPAADPSMTAAATASPPPPLAPSAPSVSPTAPVSRPCTAEAARTVPIATRPHSADVFGQLDPASPVTITARSRDGWLGFDPAVAQAANVGPFRLRWLEPSSVSTHGDCASVPQVWTPEPGVCFEMTMENVIVRAAPRANAKEVATLHPGEFAALIAREGKDWVKADLGKGNTGSSVVGFIPSESVNMSGPCDKITGP